MEVFRLRPEGSVPEDTDHEIGEDPEAARDWEKEVPTTRAFRDVVVMSGAVAEGVLTGDNQRSPLIILTGFVDPPIHITMLDVAGRASDPVETLTVRMISPRVTIWEESFALSPTRLRAMY